MSSHTCPRCDREAFRYIPCDDADTIDTIGSILICATTDGVYLHGHDAAREFDGY